MRIPIEKKTIRIREMINKRCVIEACADGKRIIVASNQLQNGEDFTDKLREELTKSGIYQSEE